jgi:hypothetical protein
MPGNQSGRPNDHFKPISFNILHFYVQIKISLYLYSYNPSGINYLLCRSKKSLKLLFYKRIKSRFLSFLPTEIVVGRVVGNHKVATLEVMIISVLPNLTLVT